VDEELKQRSIKELATSINGNKVVSVYSYHKNKWLTPAMNQFCKKTHGVITKDRWFDYFGQQLFKNLA